MCFLKSIPVDKLKKLIANGDAARLEIEDGDGNTKDVFPVLHVRAGSSAQWLLSEYDEVQERFFGLCDLGQGFPELGYVALSELDELTDVATPEINGAFEAHARLSTYARVAHSHACIVLNVTPDQT